MEDDKTYCKNYNNIISKPFALDYVRSAYKCREVLTIYLVIRLDRPLFIDCRAFLSNLIFSHVSDWPITWDITASSSWQRNIFYIWLCRWNMLSVASLYRFRTECRPLGSCCHFPLTRIVVVRMSSCVQQPTSNATDGDDNSTKMNSTAVHNLRPIQPECSVRCWQLDVNSTCRPRSVLECCKNWRDIQPFHLVFV